MPVFVTLALALAACSGSAVGPAAKVPNVSDASRANVRAARGLALPAMLPSRAHRSVRAHPNIIPGAFVFYSGNFFTNTITVYPEKGINPPPRFTISTGLVSPERIFVDAHRYVYVTNGIGNSIVIYKPGKTTPTTTITSGVVTPTGLTVGADGTIYCANTGNSTVTEYPAGSTSPSLTVTLGNQTPEDLAIGPGNVLYVSYIGGPTNSGVIAVQPGQTTGKDAGLTIGDAAGIAVDSIGNLIVADMASSTVDVFPPGQTTPSKTLSAGGLPFELSLSGSQKSLFVSTEIGSAFAIQSIAYPALDKLSTKISASAGDWPLASQPDLVN